MIPENMRRQVEALLQRAHIPLSKEELSNLKAVDFGLHHLARYGVQLIEYINNERYCARQLVLLPRQIIPEHMHPPVGNDPGKVETFRVVFGKVWVYTEGEPTASIAADLTQQEKPHFSVFHEIELNKGEAWTSVCNQYHWFQAGGEGAVVIEFSSPARDQFDVFTDPRVKTV